MSQKCPGFLVFFLFIVLRNDWDISARLLALLTELLYNTPFALVCATEEAEHPIISLSNCIMETRVETTVRVF